MLSYIKLELYAQPIARHVRDCTSISGLLEMEGPPQGDSAAMPIYEMAIMPMILIFQ